MEKRAGAKKRMEIQREEKAKVYYEKHESCKAIKLGVPQGE